MMRESYAQVYKFRNEYRSYLDVFARQTRTNFKDLETNKYEVVNDMYIQLAKINDWLYGKMTDNLAEMN